MLRLKSKIYLDENNTCYIDFETSIFKGTLSGKPIVNKLNTKELITLAFLCRNYHREVTSKDIYEELKDIPKVKYDSITKIMSKLRAKMIDEKDGDSFIKSSVQCHFRLVPNGSPFEDENNEVKQFIDEEKKEEEKEEEIIEGITLEYLIKERELEFIDSTIVQKIRSKKIQHALELSRYQPELNNASNINNTDKQITPYELHEKKNNFEEERLSQGKHFSLIDPPGFRTYVYEICYTIDRYKSIRLYTLNRAKETQEILDNGYIKRTFYIIDVQVNGNQLCIFTTCVKAEFVSVSLGLLLGDEVKITKHEKCPVFELYPEINNDLDFLDQNRFNIDENLYPHHSKANEIWVPSIISNNVPIVFDLEDFEPILRKVYYSEDNKNMLAKAKIKKGHKYFAINIGESTSSGEISSTRKLSNIEKGKYYKSGSHGFPKDFEKAAECFEKEGSAEAFFYLANLFLEEDIYDEELYNYYLTKSAALGYPQAIQSQNKKE